MQDLSIHQKKRLLYFLLIALIASIVITAIISKDFFLLIACVIGVIFTWQPIKGVIAQIGVEPTKAAETPQPPSPQPSDAAAAAVNTVDSELVKPAALPSQAPQPELRHCHALLIALAAKDPALITKAEDRLQEILDLSRIRHG